MGGERAGESSQDSARDHFNLDIKEKHSGAFILLDISGAIPCSHLTRNTCMQTE